MAHAVTIGGALYLRTVTPIMENIEKCVEDSSRKTSRVTIVFDSSRETL